MEQLGRVTWSESKLAIRKDVLDSWSTQMKSGNLACGSQRLY